MMKDQNTVTLELADDKGALVLAVRDQEGRSLAQANLGWEEIVPLSNQWRLGMKALLDAQGLSIDLDPDSAEPIPAPITGPSGWRLGWLDSGEPVIAHESPNKYWLSFSMTVEDGRKLRDALCASSGHRPHDRTQALCSFYFSRKAPRFVVSCP
jgi:hypothetical protein